MEWPDWLSFTAQNNKELLVAAIGSLAGAVGGAWAAQRIADKTRRRETLLQEYRACGHAIEIAHNIASTYLNAKKQHVKSLKEGYDEQRAAMHELHAANAAGALPPGLQVQVNMDFGSMNQVRTRAAYLETLVLERMPAPVRPRSLAVVLTRCTEQLNETLAQRNQLVQKLETIPEPERFARVFGLPLPHGFDNTYRDYVDSIYQYTDSIQFSHMIVEDLRVYGERAREAYQKSLPRRRRRYVAMVPVVYWNDPAYAGMMPPKKNYSSYYTGFVYRVPLTRGRYYGKAVFALRVLMRSGLKYASCGMRWESEKG